MTQPMTQLREPVVVVGLGLTGLACVRYLLRHGVTPTVTDSRTAPPGLDALQREAAHVVAHCGELDRALLNQAGTVLVSPGVALSTPALVEAAAAGAELIGDIELFARQTEVPVVAITGSNGKSTVTTLVGEMARQAGLRVAVGGNLGRPALELLDEPAELYVLELSSFQLETTCSLQPVAAAVLNLSPDHQDRYADMASYAAAKQRILRGAATAILNRDDPWVAAMADPKQATRWFTLGDPEGADLGVIDVSGVAWLVAGEERLMQADEVALSGQHNRANALAALAIGRAIGLPLAAMRQVLGGFSGLPHRSRRVAEIDGVVWYNDSKGTNVGATLAAVAGIPGERIVLIAGGDGKGADFAPLAGAVAERCRAVVLIGRDAPRLQAALAETVPLQRAETLKEAVQQAAELARPGDSVLLSPACASLDMFRDYADRGEQFEAAVNRLRREVNHVG